eukprot:scaffold377_cov563-Prasinococcus_capsulatus_cf.AAC.27
MCRWSGNGASYTKLCDQHVRCSLIKGVVEGKPKRLIEAVAEDIASKLLQQSRDIQIVRVEVAKEKPPIAGILEGVSVRIVRHQTCLGAAE